jgi:hypothetical protein
MTKTYLSYGGGINSSALMVLKENEIEEAVFVNHGGDYPDTYQYVEYMIKQGFPIMVIKPNVEGFSSLYDFCMAKRLIPSRLRRWCTDKFKITPLTEYVDTPSNMLIGFCLDEIKRVKSDFRFKRYIRASYPLIKEGITREGCVKILQDAGLTVPRKSCCFFCPFQRSLEARRLYLEYPDLYLKCEALEKNCMRQDLFISDKPISKRALCGVPPITRWTGD